MPIEIREIVIKTDVRTNVSSQNSQLTKSEIQKMKNQLMLECKKMVENQLKRKQIKR